jgi:DNA integrity scanning protein DisA with diadenylate cyclase activity
MLELIYKKPKSANIEDLNIIDVFDKDNKIIDGAIVVLGDLISIKCYIRY